MLSILGKSHRQLMCIPRLLKCNRS